MIFPEGGNFTRSGGSGIDRLRKLGMERMASRAEAMTHVLAPRPGGFLAALDAAPDADVVLVAHTGLDHLLTVRDLWRELPMDKQIIMRWWQVRARRSPRAARRGSTGSSAGGKTPWIEQNRPKDLSSGRHR